ncbi:MAG TPA: hypothetical protein PLT76_03335 [Candidatus Omnitrophota bacterium]|nr:hypothetical protein [Candidatus Omnitrophota bacterium]HPB68174.1 hypothetical protein [Candidatus Omnitrophota bacterium]HQO57734.1 hypothetical protein [Candidatus Omnitrophota bacterium]HQP11936.1 hypothetical protein [Candidatus Omnitrophota bacterium]
MKNIMFVLLVSFGVFVWGCGQQQNQAQTDPQGSQGAGQRLQDVKNVTSEMTQKAQELLTQARQYLDQGKFDQAISLAQDVLSFDPKNIDAAQIIETAKAKLKALAEQKAGEVQSGLMDKLGTMGQ